jgi:N-methylhydantoinase B/oxoprolinase/acetone carboxylase alpha subunit
MFEPVRAWLPAVPAPSGSSVHVPVGRGGCSFSDDLVRPAGGGRIAVRVRITDRDDGSGWVIDLRDSDPPEGSPAFSLSEASAVTAVAIAFGAALGEPGPIATSRLSLEIDPSTWVGGEDAEDPAVVAFGLARVQDAVSGALANAWPGRVGAGSCSLGAIVAIESEGEHVLEVLPGGEGATPKGPGRDAWSGPILSTRLCDAPPPWLAIDHALRSGSGGVGARRGGEGIRRAYRVSRDAVARVAIDRLDNPPHGIDRAGPPIGARLSLQRPGAGTSAVRPWATTELPRGSTLVVETCGGAGHGFPGWGDIDWAG